MPQWSVIQGLMMIKKRPNETWQDWREIVGVYNYIREELSIEPVSVRIIGLDDNSMTVEIYGVYRSEMYESLRRRLETIINTLKLRYTVEYAWTTGG